MPQVSVVIKVYNGEQYLAESIESVLGQTYQDFELIVVDDGSVDGTSAVIDQYGDQLRRFYHENAGVSTTMNRGVQESQGAFIAFQDADDLWEPDKLEKQMALMEQEPDLMLVFCHVRQFISPELSEEAKRRLVCPPDPMPGMLTQCMLTRRAVFDSVGMFRQEWRFGELVDWYSRTQDAGYRSFMMPDVLVRRRLHSTNSNFLQRDQHIHYVHAVKAMLDRRRSKNQ